MSNLLHHKITGTPLPSGMVVLRLLRASKDGKALESHFALSEEDKSATLPALSVWIETLTTPEQARALLGEKQIAYEIYCRLPVDTIRTINVPASPQVALDVVWDTLFQEGTDLPDARPGAE